MGYLSMIERGFTQKGPSFDGRKPRENRLQLNRIDSVDLKLGGAQFVQVGRFLKVLGNKNAMAIFLATIGTIGLLFTPTSGHSGGDVES